MRLCTSHEQRAPPRLSAAPSGYLSNRALIGLHTGLTFTASCRYSGYLSNRALIGLHTLDRFLQIRFRFDPPLPCTAYRPSIVNRDVTRGEHRCQYVPGAHRAGAQRPHATGRATRGRDFGRISLILRQAVAIASIRDFDLKQVPPLKRLTLTG